MLFPIAPIVSKEAVKLNTPFNETEPGVSFKAYSAATAAGETRDPDVSLPRAIGLKPEATPTAEPVDEPKGAYCVSIETCQGSYTYSLPSGELSKLVSCRDVGGLAHPPYSRPPTRASSREVVSHRIHRLRMGLRIGYILISHTSFHIIPSCSSFQG